MADLSKRSTTLSISPTDKFRVCWKCVTRKPAEDFPVKRRHGKIQHSGKCRECCYEQTRQWRATHRAEVHELNQAYYKSGHGRDHHLRNTYGITLAEFEALLKKQDNKCAICENKHIEEPWKRLQVDHCHETGVVRGLLCGTCNRAIGMLGDTAEQIKKVINYLGGNRYGSQ